MNSVQLKNLMQLVAGFKMHFCQTFLFFKKRGRGLASSSIAIGSLRVGLLKLFE